MLIWIECDPSILLLNQLRCSRGCQQHKIDCKFKSDFRKPNKLLICTIIQSDWYNSGSQNSKRICFGNFIHFFLIYLSIWLDLLKCRWWWKRTLKHTFHPYQMDAFRSLLCVWNKMVFISVRFGAFQKAPPWQIPFERYATFLDLYYIIPHGIVPSFFGSLTSSSLSLCLHGTHTDIFLFFYFYLK